MLSSDTGGYVFNFGARCNLPGDIQTVSRAELYAILVVVRFVTHGYLCVVSDSEITVDMYHKGRDIAEAPINGDLWSELFALVAS